MGKLMRLLFWECHYSTLSPSKRSVKARGKRRTFTGSWTRFPIDCTFVHDDFIKVDNVLLTERFQPLITLLHILASTASLDLSARMRRSKIRETQGKILLGRLKRSSANAQEA